MLESEIINAKKLLSAQTRPLTTIISGAKISTKLTLIKKLILKSDHIILGGGILNTFLSAMGNNIGNSLVESSFINEAKEILNGEHSKKIIMPIDVVSTDSLSLDNLFVGVLIVVRPGLEGFNIYSLSAFMAIIFLTIRERYLFS